MSWTVRVSGRLLRGRGEFTLVVGVEDDVLIRFVGCRKRLPELLHAGYIGDDLVVVAAVIVGDDHGVGFLVSDVFDGLSINERVDLMFTSKMEDSYIIKILEVRCVESAVQFVGNNALHHNVDAEGVEPFADELLERISLMPSDDKVICKSLHQWYLESARHSPCPLHQASSCFQIQVRSH